MMPLSPDALRIVGAALLAVMAAMIASCGTAPRTLGLRWKWLRFTIPARRDFVAQIALAIVDVIAAGLALWALLPHAQVGFGEFITVFSAAMLLGMIGHTPGGVGVFEASMVFALGGSVQTPEMVAALLAYRAIYFGLPLILSAAVMAAFEGRALKGRFAFLRPGHVSQLAPLFLSIVTFVAGSMLVISGATPAFAKRIALLQTILPLWVLESSQLLGSVLGVLLLFVARGLLRRLDAAWWLALILAVTNLALSLAKGLAFVEAGMLGFLIVLLDRDARPLQPPLVALRRALHGDLAGVGRRRDGAGRVDHVLRLPRRSIQRATSGGSSPSTNARRARCARRSRRCCSPRVFAMWQLLRPAAGRFVKPAPQDLLDAARIFRAQERSDAGLAMMGDKSFLFSESREAFLMYAKHGRTWAALHDPVGPRREWAELIRKFVELAHSHNGRAAFYQVRADALPLYLDAGLTLMKLGEEAHVVLADFDLKGSHRAHLRYALKRGERDGFDVEVIDPARVPESLPMLREISDAWLDSRLARARRASRSRRSPTTTSSAQSVLLVRQQGAPVAFVTFMTTDMNTEATVGVMRHLPDASPYAMEYLFTKLALHLKQAGFQSLQSWHRAAVRHAADAARVSLASAGRLGLAVRRPFLQFPRPARIQEQVPAALGAALSRGVRLGRRIFHARGSLVAGGRLAFMTFFVESRRRGLSFALSSAAHAATMPGGRYGDVDADEARRPDARLRRAVLRESGWSPADQQAADALAKNGAMVVGVDTARYAATCNAGGEGKLPSTSSATPRP